MGEDIQDGACNTKRKPPRGLRVYGKDAGRTTAPVNMVQMGYKAF